MFSQTAKEAGGFGTATRPNGCRHRLIDPLQCSWPSTHTHHINVHLHAAKQSVSNAWEHGGIGAIIAPHAGGLDFSKGCLRGQARINQLAESYLHRTHQQFLCSGSVLRPDQTLQHARMAIDALMAGGDGGLEKLFKATHAAAHDLLELWVQAADLPRMGCAAQDADADLKFG